MTNEGPWAHSKNDEQVRHGLVEHVEAVAAMAKGFAEPFGGGELAYWAGLWHDLGKFHPEFQQYLMDCEDTKARDKRPPARKVDHKGAGTAVAARHNFPLAFLVAGHHGGLHANGDLRARLNEWQSAARVGEALTRAGAALALEPTGPIAPPAWTMTGGTKDEQARRFELLVRVLFSCLVDADFLDTEKHFQVGRAGAREGAPPVAGLQPLLDAYMADLRSRAKPDAGERGQAVAAVRDEVYQACVNAGPLPPGLFRLTVPTGGGKTLAGMAFALAHARAHNLERVIVAVPYTSITEQTADVYRKVFGEAGERAVLEHHSAVPLQEHQDDEGDGGPEWNRLAAENWDAPVIVTTTVRLFESLFARTPSATRRVHRITNSVVILDEAQTLPTRLLTPILDVLGELAAHYKTSVVLCTATQPALNSAPGFQGLNDVREIAPKPSRLFSTLQRVQFEWPKEGERWTWEQAAAAMRSERQALAVVNTKADALALLKALDDLAGDKEALHLSTLLCGAHRRDVLKEVRRRLAAGEPCHLVSTQVVEAGVDLDFPLVLRAMGPLDRIVQAAGRCNREGRLPGLGRVVVFDPAEGGMPPGNYKSGAGVAALMLASGEVRPDDPATFPRYFSRLYRQVELDAEGIQGHRKALDFPTVAEKFRLIDDDGTGVIVKYQPPRTRDGEQPDPVKELLTEIEKARKVTRELLRRAQPFMVTVRGREQAGLLQAGLIEEVREGVHVWRSGYDSRRGITRDGISPERFIV